MMDLDAKMHGARGSLIIPSAIRGDLGAFASVNNAAGSSGGGVSSNHGSQLLNLGQRQRFDEDSNISLIKVMSISFFYINLIL